jgi:hypothetical protein
MNTANGQSLLLNVKTAVQNPDPYESRVPFENFINGMRDHSQVQNLMALIL